MHLSDFCTSLDRQSAWAEFSTTGFNVLEERLRVVLVVANVFGLAVEMLGKSNLRDILLKCGATHICHRCATITAIVRMHVVIKGNSRRHCASINYRGNFWQEQVIRCLL